MPLVLSPNWSMYLYASYLGHDFGDDLCTIRVLGIGTVCVLNPGRWGLQGHTCRSRVLMTGFIAVPKGSNVVPFWVVYFHPQAENKS